MKTSSNFGCLGMALAMLVLFGSLATSFATDDGRWFICGYPLAIIGAGLFDPKEPRAAIARVVGFVFLAVALFVLWVTR